VASGKKKANIELDQTVHPGSAQLTPADFKMTWTEGAANTDA